MLTFSPRHTPWQRHAFGGLLAMLLVMAPAGAAVFQDLSDELLAERSPLIVSGWVLDREAGKATRDALPQVGYRVQVDRIIKGTPPDELVVWLPGGTREGIAFQIAGVPRFERGQEVLLFLRQTADGRFVPVHPLLGAFEIVEGELGKLARRPALDSGASARDLDLFLTWLVDARRPPDYLVSSTGGGEQKGRQDGHKFEQIISSADAPPFGCGENGGHPVRWFEFDPPDGSTSGTEVHWRLHFSGQEGLEDGGLEPFRTALATWTLDPHSTVELELAGLTSSTGGLAASDGVNSLLFGDPGDLIPGSVEDTGILALGGPWFRCDLVEHDGELFHPILEADIITNQGLDRFLAAVPDPRRTAEEILAHELGHTLGFAHSPDPEALMFATVHADGRGGALGIDDLAGLLALYGEGELEPPDAPSDLFLSSTSPTSIQVAWRDNSSNESNFRLERDGGEGFVQISAMPADLRTFHDQRARPETTYRYRVRAQNAAGASTYSAVANITTPRDRRPAAPSNLRAAPLSSDRIRLTWQDNSSDEHNFVLFILDARTMEFIEIPAPVPAETTSVFLTELNPHTVYTLRVAARNSFGTSPMSNVAAAATFPPEPSCEVSGQELCLLNGRFRARVFFTDPATGVETAASAVPSSDQIGLFWFFEAGNIELIVKMLDGRELNDHFWAFYGGVSDLEYRLEITDTSTGQVKTYRNARGELCGQADTTAFDDPGKPGSVADVKTPLVEDARDQTLGSGPPEITLRPLPATSAGRAGKGEAAGLCEPGPTTLCLLDGRLQIELDWSDPRNGIEGAGQAVYSSDNSGYFWFFGPENLELVVKALDGRSINDHLWLFYGALTDLPFSLTVTDTLSGETRLYENPAGEVCGRADTSAFDLR